MARRGENIRKRKDGRWEARYIKGRKADGTIQYGYVYSRKYSDVKTKRQEALLMLQESSNTSPIKIQHVRFNQFCDEWIENIRFNIKKGLRA